MVFKPGESGNPGGRKRNTFVTDALIMEMKARDKDGDTRGVRKVAITIWDEAEKGERWAAEFIRDTLDGKPIQAVEGEVNHTGDNPLLALLGRVATQGQPLVTHDSAD